MPIARRSTTRNSLPSGSPRCRLPQATVTASAEVAAAPPEDERASEEPADIPPVVCPVEAPPVVTPAPSPLPPPVVLSAEPNPEPPPVVAEQDAPPVVVSADGEPEPPPASTSVADDSPSPEHAWLREVTAGPVRRPELTKPRGGRPILAAIGGAVGIVTLLALVYYLANRDGHSGTDERGKVAQKTSPQGKASASTNSRPAASARRTADDIEAEPVIDDDIPVVPPKPTGRKPPQRPGEPAVSEPAPSDVRGPPIDPASRPAMEPVELPPEFKDDPRPPIRRRNRRGPAPSCTTLGYASPCARFRPRTC